MPMSRVPGCPGLHLTADAARWVELARDRDGHLRLRRHAEIALPTAAPAAALTALADGAAVRVALELPLRLCRGRVLSLPAELDDDALESPLAWEAEALTGLAGRALAFDFSRRGADPQRPGRQRVLLVATDAAALQARLALVRSAGLRPARVDVDALALRAAALHSDPAVGAGPWLLAWLDGGQLTLVLLHDAEPIGLHHQALAPADAAQLGAALAPALAPLRAGGGPRPRLRLGGDPELAGWVGALGAALGVDVDLLDPWRGLSDPPAPDPRFGVACGLALGQPPLR